MVMVQEPLSGLQAILALHATDRGPAFGGVRVLAYRSEEDALADALRLSRAMTYKCALAGVPGGGGKAVVLADRILNRRDAMEALGREVEQLGGAFYTAGDLGCTATDHAALQRTTQYVAHRGPEVGMRSLGEATADGGYWGLRAAAAYRFDSDDLSERHILVQGAGAVGGPLVAQLLREGARVTVSDPDPGAAEAARARGATVVDPQIIFDIEADIFCPCALGGVLHEVTIRRLRCSMVAGLANNVLAHEDLSANLQQRGILLVPDFVLNAGALIEGAGHGLTGRTEWSEELRGIGSTVQRVLERAERMAVPPTEAAYDLAREVLAEPPRRQSIPEQQQGDPPS